MLFIVASWDQRIHWMMGRALVVQAEKGSGSLQLAPSRAIL